MGVTVHSLLPVKMDLDQATSDTPDHSPPDPGSSQDMIDLIQISPDLYEVVFHPTTDSMVTTQELDTEMMDLNGMMEILPLPTTSSSPPTLTNAMRCRKYRDKKRRLNAVMDLKKKKLEKKKIKLEKLVKNMEEILTRARSTLMEIVTEKTERMEDGGSEES